MKRGNGEDREDSAIFSKKILAEATDVSSKPPGFTIEDKPVNDIVNNIQKWITLKKITSELLTDIQETSEYSFKHNVFLEMDKTSVTGDKTMDDQETFFIKYLDQRFKNIEDKIDYSIESTTESKKDTQNLVNIIQDEVSDISQRITTITSTNKHILWAVIGIIIAILLGFAGIIWIG